MHRAGAAVLIGAGLVVAKILRFVVNKIPGVVDNLVYRVEKFGYKHSGWIKDIFPSPKSPKKKDEKKK